jgi:hypothetical protein
VIVFQTSRLQSPPTSSAPPADIMSALSFWPWFVYVDVAEAITRFPGHRITSWWRTKARNAAVGGHPDSQHLIGLAVDVAPQIPASALKRWLTLDLVLIEEGDHTHAQLLRAGVATPWVRHLAR